MRALIHGIFWCLLISFMQVDSAQQQDSCHSLTNKCCKQLATSIDKLKAKLNKCCADQATCCTEIQNSLTNIENTLAACCPGDSGAACTFLITEIPAGGLIIDKPGHYIVCKPLSFSGNSIEALNQQSLLKSYAEQGLVAASFADTAFGVTIASDAVFFDLNSQTYTLSGTNTGGFLVMPGIAGTLISNGTVKADNSPGQFGVAITTVSATIPAATASTAVTGVTFAHIAGAPSAALAAPATPTATAASIAPAAALAVASATAAAVDPSGDLPSLTAAVKDPIMNNRVFYQNLEINDSLNGLSFAGNATNVFVQNVSINRSTQMGITQPSRSGFHGNFNFENVAIANSGLNGIYTTFNQDNWTFNKIQIRNSGLNGAIFEGTQNLTFNNSQISQSGAKGLVASIRQSQNIAISGLEVFNSGDENLRIDNVQNLSITNSKFINYTPTGLPVVKIQDVNNALIEGNDIMSAAGFADGLFIRNSRGSLIQNNTVKVFSNVTPTTPIPQPPVMAASGSSSLTSFIQQQYCMPTPVACTGSFPVGINLQGGATASLISRCVVSGTPSVGIAVQLDTLNGFDEGVMIEQCVIDGAQCAGILFASAVNAGVFSTKVLNGQGDGILIDVNSSQTAVRDNTVINNRGFGIRNLGTNSQIYHNFASGNGRNYSSGILVALPGPGVGSLENISG